MGSSCIDKDIEMDLGEIGIDGEQQNKCEEEWAALDNEVVESSDSEEDEELLNDALLGVAGTILDPSAAPAASSDSELDMEDEMTAPKRAPKKRQHKLYVERHIHRRGGRLCHKPNKHIPPQHFMPVASWKTHKFKVQINKNKQI